MVYQEKFKFKLSKSQNDSDLTKEETIFQAIQHDGVYDLYVINGLDIHRERVATFIDNGEWIIV